MGIFPTFVERRAASGGRYGPLNDWWYSLLGEKTNAGQDVSEENAMRYLTVHSCVTLIAGDVAGLPLKKYQRLQDGSKKIINDPVAKLLRVAPNNDMTAFTWRETGQGHLLLWGNSYHTIERSLNGRPKAVHPIENPGSMRILRLPDGDLFYKWRAADGQERGQRSGSILHIPGFGFSGFFGRSMIGLAREAIGLGLSLDEFAARFFSEGTHPAGIISMEEPLGENEADYLKALKANYSGLGKSHSVMVLQNNEKYTSLSMPLEDAQFLESRQHQKTDICGFYRVPPHKVAIHGANSNYNNLEQENQNYVNSCLLPWVKRWEQSLSLKLLTPEEQKNDYFFEFNLDGLLRGDSESRGNYYNRLFNIGVMSINDIRDKENLNPIPGGDQRFVPLNMIPLDSAEALPLPAKPAREVKPLLIEQRSPLARDRLQERYYPLIRSAAREIVDYEAAAVRKRLQQSRGRRDLIDELAEWLQEFYDQLQPTIRRDLGPVFHEFAKDIRRETALEVGIDLDSAVDVTEFVDGYIERYAVRHTDSSRGQLTALLTGELDNLETRLAEWQDTRPDKTARNETTRAGSAVFQAVVFGAGMLTIFRNRGPETCPFCRTLNNTPISRGGALLNDGDELEGQDTDRPPMKIVGAKLHPPIHDGCDCYLTAG